MTKTKKLFSNSVTSIIAKFLNALLQIICLPILLKVYGKEGYGLIAIAMSFNTLITILQIGLPTGIPKFVAEWFAKKDYSVMQKATGSVFSFYLILAAINFFIILVIRYFFVSYFKISPNEILIFKKLLVITAAVSFISIPYNYLEQLLSGVQEIAFNARMQMFKNILFACLVLFVLLKPDSLTIVQFYGINCLTMIAVIPWQVSKWLRYGTIKSFIPQWHFKEVAPLFRYCLHLFVMGVFIIMADKMKPFILSIRSTGYAAAKMADYQIVYNIVMFLNMISASFMAALVPYISHEYAVGNHAIYKKVIQDVTKPVWAFSAFIVFIIILLAKELLTLYVGPENLYLEKWLVLFLAGYAYISYSSCLASVVLASGRTLPYTIGTAIACVVSLSSCWFLVPLMGMGGLIYAFIVHVCILSVVAHFYYLPTIFGVSPFGQISRVFFPPVVFGVCMVFSMRYFLNLLHFSNIYANIFIGTFVGFIVYIVMILTVYIKPRELRLLFNRVVPIQGNN